MELNDPVALTDFGWDPLLRIAGAVLAGLLLGIDREVRGYGAGLRTHALASFGAALMTVSALALHEQLSGPDTRIDPLRVIEGTGSAIGILAAALVIFTGKEVRNLTTAVHLWVAAVLGIVFGAGQYPLGVAGLLFSVLILTVLRLGERRWFPESDDGKG